MVRVSVVLPNLSSASLYYLGIIIITEVGWRKGLFADREIKLHGPTGGGGLKIIDTGPGSAKEPLYQQF